jgi:hypothetical protein
MDQPAWLQRYYGKAMVVVHPKVILEGKKKALVQLRKGTETAYVLLDKNGLHNFSAHEALHEGVASPAKLEEMKALLVDRDR